MYMRGICVVFHAPDRDLRTQFLSEHLQLYLFITLNITKFLMIKPYRAFYIYNCKFLLTSTEHVNCFLAFKMEYIEKNANANYLIY